MSRRPIRILLSLVLLFGALGLAACRAQQPAADQPTDQTTTDGEDDAAPEAPPEEPAPEEPASSVDTETLVIATIGEPETMDPAWTYETTGSGLQQNIYDTMIYFNREQPDDFVIATGQTHSVADLCRVAFDAVGKDWREHVRSNETFIRPAEVDDLVGDASRARSELGWAPKVSFEQLIQGMVEHDIQLARRGEHPPDGSLQ